MKITLWSLLLLNGLLAAVWLAGFSLPPKPVGQPTVPTPGAKPLQLLSELSQPMPGMHEPHNASAPAEEADAITTSSDSGEPAPPGAAPGEPVDKAEPPATVVPQPRAESEPSPSDPAAAEPAVPVAQQAPVAAAMCYRTGLVSGDAYEAAGATLREAGATNLQLAPQARARPRYWVFWTGAQDEVEAVVQRLKAAAERDWYRMRGGRQEARLSLGLFGRRDSARRRQRELADMGIEAQIGEDYAPQARLRWTFSVDPGAVDTLKTRLQGTGMSLQACP